MFEGEVKSDNKTYSPQGEAIPRERSFQTTKASVVLKFSRILTLSEKDKLMVSSYPEEKYQEA